MRKICLCILLALLIGFDDGINAHEHKPKHHHQKGKKHRHQKDIDLSKKAARFYELKKGNTTLKFTNWGASMVSFITPDSRGHPTDIILGYDTIEEYKNDVHYMGAIVGRVSNRIKNAEFKLNEAVYKLCANLEKDTYNGGGQGFSKVLWRVTSYRNKGPSPHIVFSYHSPDGDQGFPSKLVVSVMYSLTGKNDLTIVMKAKNAGSKPTPVSMAQHNYWNLGGHTSGNIMSEEIQIFADNYTPVGPDQLPVGQVFPVSGTLFDFREPEVLGIRIAQLPTGYDINYALNEAHGGKKIKRAARVSDSRTGMIMDVYTNAPGMQFYTPNAFNNMKGKCGNIYQNLAALSLQTQHYPNFVNVPCFPQSIVQPKQVYRHHMMFKFSFQ